MTYLEEAKSPDFKDQKTGLVVFGILQIILGGICALLVPLIILSMIVSTAHDNIPARSMSAGTTIPGVMLYALLAIWLIWMGIGSIKARRWARALILVSSWFWIIGGIIGLLFMLLLMPDMYDQMGRNEQMPQAMPVIVKYLMTGFMAVIGVVIPGVLILFYGRKNVKLTCEFRDSRVRWTDKCPLPVLLVSFFFGFGAVSMLFTGFSGWVIPFFGFILSGLAGAGITLVVILLLGYVAWGTYKLSVKVWLCAVLVIIAGTLSIGITFSRASVWDFYEKMNFPEQQLEMMKPSLIQHGSTLLLLFGILLIGFLVYLLYTKRYFETSSKESQMAPS